MFCALFVYYCFKMNFLNRYYWKIKGSRLDKSAIRYQTDTSDIFFIPVPYWTWFSRIIKIHWTSESRLALNKIVIVNFCEVVHFRNSNNFPIHILQVGFAHLESSDTLIQCNARPVGSESTLQDLGAGTQVSSCLDSRLSSQRFFSLKKYKRCKLHKKV